LSLPLLLSKSPHHARESIAPATSGRGGGRPASTRSRLPAGSGKRRAAWDDGRLNDRHYLGRMARPHPLTPKTRQSAPPQRRKKNLACQIFQASSARQRVARGSPMTMWRPNEPVEEDLSDLLGIDPHSKRRRSRRGAWR
jgi:hypothetical protein